jgi:hypothetical protein
MQYCLNCGIDLPFGQDPYCPKCGHAMAKNRPQTPGTGSDQASPTLSAPAHAILEDDTTPKTLASKIAAFFAFRWMITPQIVKIGYVLVAIAITYYSIAIPFSPEGEKYFPNTSDKIGASLVALCLFNLIWRIICERIILAFSNHELLDKIHHHTRK